MLENKKLKLVPETKTSELNEITAEEIIDNNMSKQQLDIDHIKIDNIIDKHNAEKGFLFSILQDLQKEQGYLTPEALIHVSRRLDIPIIQVYRVAMFYKEFNVEPLSEATTKNRDQDGNIKIDYLSKFRKKGSA